MDGLRQKLANLKLEESSLNEKLTQLDGNIREAKLKTDSLQYEIQSLVSSEKLLKLKLDAGKRRLSSVETSLSSHERMLDSAGENAKTNVEDSHEEELESELNAKREELRLLHAQHVEIDIHTQQVEAEKKRKEDRALVLERDVAKLESEHLQIKQAWDKAESVNAPDDIIAELELKVKDYQKQLDEVINRLELSQREVVRLDRLISLCNDELDEQRKGNERLKKEFDGICSELQSI